MWFLNVVVICFTLYNYNIPMSEAVIPPTNPREKPPRVLRTSLPKLPASPESPKENIKITPIPDLTDESSSVGEKIIVKTKTKTNTIFYESDSGDSTTGRINTFTRIPLSDDSDSDTYAPPKHSKTPLKKKHKTKTKTKLPDMTEITESINDISETITSTVELVGKNAVMGIVKTIIKSKQFMIILVLGTIFLGIGYLLRIIYR